MCRRARYAVVTAAIAACCGTGAAQADDRVCDEVLAAVSVTADLKVPDGATCTLEGTRVQGNVQVETGGALLARGALLRQDLQSDGARFLELLPGTRVGGNVQVAETQGLPPGQPANRICGATIRGDLQLADSRAAFAIGCAEGNQIFGNLQIDDSDISTGSLIVTGNRVRGDLQLSDNATAQGAELSDNRVRQNLQCSDNSPSPVGSGNFAGSADGQCAGLLAGGAPPRPGGGRGLEELEACDERIERARFDSITVPGGATCTLERVFVRGNVVVEPGGSLLASRLRVRGNLVIGADGMLVTSRVGVKGNLQVDEGGTLDAYRTAVLGNLQTDEAQAVRIERSVVRGDVQLVKTRSSPAGGPNGICGSRVGSDLQVEEGTAPVEIGCGELRDERNAIGGNLQVADHEIAGTAGETAVSLVGNRVRGNLQVVDNAAGSGDIELSLNRVRQDLRCVDNQPAPIGSDNRVGGDAEGQCAGLAR